MLPNVQDGFYTFLWFLGSTPDAAKKNSAITANKEHLNYHMLQKIRKDQKISLYMMVSLIYGFSIFLNSSLTNIMRRAELQLARLMKAAVKSKQQMNKKKRVKKARVNNDEFDNNDFNHTMKLEMEIPGMQPKLMDPNLDIQLFEDQVYDVINSQESSFSTSRGHSEIERKMNTILRSADKDRKGRFDMSRIGDVGFVNDGGDAYSGSRGLGSARRFGSGGIHGSGGFCSGGTNELPVLMDSAHRDIGGGGSGDGGTDGLGGGFIDEFGDDGFGENRFDDALNNNFTTNMKNLNNQSFNRVSDRLTTVGSHRNNPLLSSSGGTSGMTGTKGKADMSDLGIGNMAGLTDVFGNSILSMEHVDNDFGLEFNDITVQMSDKKNFEELLNESVNLTPFDLQKIKGSGRKKRQKRISAAAKQKVEAEERKIQEELMDQIDEDNPLRDVDLLSLGFQKPISEALDRIERRREEKRARLEKSKNRKELKKQGKKAMKKRKSDAQPEKVPADIVPDLKSVFRRLIPNNDQFDNGLDDYLANSPWGPWQTTFFGPVPDSITAAAHVSTLSKTYLGEGAASILEYDEEKIERTLNQDILVRLRKMTATQATKMIPDKSNTDGEDVIMGGMEHDFNGTDTKKSGRKSGDGRKSEGKKGDNSGLNPDFAADFAADIGGGLFDVPEEEGLFGDDDDAGFGDDNLNLERSETDSSNDNKRNSISSSKSLYDLRGNVMDGSVQRLLQSLEKQGLNGFADVFEKTKDVYPFVESSKGFEVSLRGAETSRTPLGGTLSGRRHNIENLDKNPRLLHTFGKMVHSAAIFDKRNFMNSFIFSNEKDVRSKSNLKKRRLENGGVDLSGLLDSGIKESTNDKDGLGLNPDSDLKVDLGGGDFGGDDGMSGVGNDISLNDWDLEKLRMTSFSTMCSPVSEDAITAVAMFMDMLTMAKENQVYIHQEHPMEDIMIAIL